MVDPAGTDDDASRYPSSEAIVATTTTAVTRRRRTRVRYVLLRARVLEAEATPPLCEPACCGHVWRFRYAGDTRPL
jgi:hypothetical protein